MSTEDTITRDELAAALDGLRITRGETDLGLFVGNPRAFAEALFDRAARNREPEYEPGAVYLDADGTVWQYTPDRPENQGTSWADCPWLKPGSAGAYSLNTPKRPLRRLVAEGSVGLDGEALVELLERAGLSREQTNAIVRDLRHLITGEQP